MGVDHHYQKVADEGEGLIEKPIETRAPPTSSPWWKRSLIVTMAIIIAILTALLAAVGSMVVKQTDATPVTTASAVPTAPIVHTAPAEEAKAPLSDASLAISDCGYTPDEARSKGCIFDVMMQLWTPPACYDGKLSERFLEM